VAVVAAEPVTVSARKVLVAPVAAAMVRDKATRLLTRAQRTPVVAVVLGRATIFLPDQEVLAS